MNLATDLPLILQAMENFAPSTAEIGGVSYPVSSTTSEIRNSMEIGGKRFDLRLMLWVRRALMEAQAVSDTPVSLPATSSVTPPIIGHIVLYKGRSYRIMGVTIDPTNVFYKLELDTIQK